MVLTGIGTTEMSEERQATYLPFVNEHRCHGSLYELAKLESAAVSRSCMCMCVCLSGIPGELFYVQHGIVNKYALSFSIPIRSDVTDIYFVWQSLHKSPPEPLVRFLSYFTTHYTIDDALRTKNKCRIDLIGLVCGFTSSDILDTFSDIRACVSLNRDYSTRAKRSNFQETYVLYLGHVRVHV